ncbi:MAG: acylphosphatase [Myxococcaceae bacterium]
MRIKGRVQGVFFRQSAMEEARRLGLAGYVRNLPDGDVEALAEGKAESVKAFVEWCHHGPPAARVDAVQLREADAQGGFPGFTVER